MSNSAYPCIVCGVTLENAVPGVHNQPSEGIEFSTAGHYGSTFFDSLEGEELVINVCDPCLRERVDRLGMRKVRVPVVLEQHGDILVGVSNSDAVSYSAYGEENSHSHIAVSLDQLGAEYGSGFPHHVEWDANWREIKEWLERDAR